MLTFILLLIGLEYAGRRRVRFYQASGRFRPATRTVLRGRHAVLAFIVCFLPVFAGFLLPALMLVNHSITYFDRSWTPQFRVYALNSFSVSLTAAVCCALIAVVIGYTRRLHGGRWIATASRLASMGYAVPGAVLAVGLVVPLAAFDNSVDAFSRSTFGFSTGLLLSGTTFALITAYVIRFLAISIGNVESSFSKIPYSIDMASRTLGDTPLVSLRRIHLPLIRGGVLTAALIVFVDCMKELPATLLLRPFNFETLATHVYLIASDEQIERAALGSLFIVLAGLIPVIVLSRTISYSQSIRHP